MAWKPLIGHYIRCNSGFINITWTNPLGGDSQMEDSSLPYSSQNCFYQAFVIPNITLFVAIKVFAVIGPYPNFSCLTEGVCHGYFCDKGDLYFCSALHQLHWTFTFSYHLPFGITLRNLNVRFKKNVFTLHYLNRMPNTMSVSLENKRLCMRGTDCHIYQLLIRNQTLQTCQAIT